jgi:hypothetical protein
MVGWTGQRSNLVITPETIAALRSRLFLPIQGVSDWGLPEIGSDVAGDHECHDCHPGFIYQARTLANLIDGDRD